MRFPHAYKGVTKLFIAEVITIIATLVGLTSAIVAVINIDNTAVAATLSALAIVSGVALIVAFVLELIGLLQGKADEDRFRSAFFAIIFAIIFSVAATIIGSLNLGNGGAIAANVLSTLATIISVFVSVLILLGLSNLADRLGNQPMVEKGHRLINWVIILFIVSTLLGLFPNFFYSLATEQVWAVIFSVFAIVALVIEVLVYINIVIYLYRSMKMLKK